MRENYGAQPESDAVTPIKLGALGSGQLTTDEMLLLFHLLDRFRLRQLRARGFDAEHACVHLQRAIRRCIGMATSHKVRKEIKAREARLMALARELDSYSTA